jgi:hypothetical protein
MHFRPFLCLLLACASVPAALRAAPPDLLSLRVIVPPLKTSIYVGSVTLTAAPFVRHGGEFHSTYEARVRPWFFWNETGQITIRLAGAELARLAQGQTVEFTGEATNHKGRPRSVSGRAQPESPVAGRIKVRISADGIELVFNGSYAFAEQKEPDRPQLTPPSET